MADRMNTLCQLFLALVVAMPPHTGAQTEIQFTILPENTTNGTNATTIDISMADLLAAIALAGNSFDVNGTNISVLTLTGGTAPSGDGDSVRTTHR